MFLSDQNKGKAISPNRIGLLRIRVWDVGGKREEYLRYHGITVSTYLPTRAALVLNLAYRILFYNTWLVRKPC